MTKVNKPDVQEKTINRLIRCRKTNRYFRDGQWTDDSSQASIFTDEMDAVRACLDHRLTDIDLVLRAPGGNIDLFATQLR